MPLEMNTFVSRGANYTTYNWDVSIGVYPYVVFLQTCARLVFCDIIDTMMTNTERYHFLLVLCREGVATEDEKKEFYDLCQTMLYAIMWDNIDVFKRLADR